MTVARGGFSLRPFDLVLTVTESSTNSAANTSVVSWVLELDPTSSYNSYNLYNNTNYYTVVIDGVTVASTDFTFDFRTNTTTTRTLASGTRTITHNANGSKTVAFSATATSPTIGNASCSNSLALTDFVVLPAAPSGAPTLQRPYPTVGVLGTGETIRVTSASVSSAVTLSDYQYRLSTDGTTWGGAVSMGTDGWIDVTGLVTTQTYFFQTRGVSSEGNGPWNTVSPAASIVGAPATPTGLRSGYLDTVATPTESTKVALDWGWVTTNASRSRVSYKLTSDSSWTDTAYSSIATSAYQVTELTPNKSYDFRVSLESSTLRSGYATLTAPTIPSTPANFAVVGDVTNSQVALDWDTDTSGNITYNVWYRVTGGTWVNTGYSGSTSSYTVTGLAFNTEYEFRVAAVNAVLGTTSEYATLTQATLPSGPPVRTNDTTWSPSELYVWDGTTWALGSMWVWNGTTWKAAG